MFPTGLLFKHETNALAMAWKKRRSRLNDIAEGLVKAGALQFGTFSLPDGRDSSYYVNLRSLPSYPGVYGLVVGAMADLVSNKLTRADALCAVPLTSLIFASPMAVRVGKPLIYRREAKQEDVRVVEGEVRPGWDVIMVGDVSTSGDTILSGARTVQDEGGKVSAAVVAVDRLEGAREMLSKNGIALHAVTDVVELADTLYSMELISSESLKAITKSVGAR